MEQRHLAQADRHIADGEIRIAEQLARIARLEVDGHDTKEAKRTLANFEECQKQYEAHRQMIAGRLAAIHPFEADSK